MVTYLNFKGLQNPETGETITHPLFNECLMVNGVLKTPDDNGVITLTAGSTYVISGRHYGRIVIGTATDEPADDTFIILDGVEIFANDANAYGIYYAPAAQSLFVTLARNKANKIICQKVQEMASDQGACLFSENNMVVQGCGYLTVVNKGGHGVRASELRISGEPHIYVEAEHDAIHGNSRLQIDGGLFYVNGANDAFGTGTTGKILAYKCKAYCYGIKQTCFDSKNAGIWGDVTVDTDATTVKDNMSAKTYGSASIKVNDVELDLSSADALNITAAEGAVIDIAGSIAGNINIAATKAQVNLKDCYISGSLSYTLGSSNMQVTSVADTYNVITQNIASSNNLKIEAKGGSYLTVGGNVTGSELTIHDSKGVVRVTGMVKGTDVYIADSADHKAYDDEAVYGCLYLGSLQSRKSSKGKKSNITIKADNLRGCVVTDKVEAETGSTDTTGVKLNKSVNLFVKNAISGDLVTGKVPLYTLPYEYIPYGIGTFAV